MNFKRHGIHKKKTVSEERNNPKNITDRQCYARKVQFIPDRNLVFLDEIGTNLHQS